MLRMGIAPCSPFSVSTECMVEGEQACSVSTFIYLQCLYFNLASHHAATIQPSRMGVYTSALLLSKSNLQHHVASNQQPWQSAYA